MILAIDRFSAEELNLMGIFDTADREVLRSDLLTALHDVYDPDMIEFSEASLKAGQPHR